MSVLTLKVDFAKCIKAGECYYNHPDLFGMAGSGFPTLRLGELGSDRELKEAREAAEVCPSGAISLT